MMPPSIIPTPYRILALIVAAALTFVAIAALGWSYGTDHVQQQWDKAKAEQLRIDFAAEQAERARESAWSNKLQEAQDNAAKRETALRQIADAARASVGGLRDAISATRRDLLTATPAACRSTADAATTALGECAEQYRAVAEDADRADSAARQLIEAWPE